MKKLFCISIFLYILFISIFTQAQTFTIITDPNRHDTQKRIVEQRIQNVEGIELSIPSITSIAEKKAKIERNRQSIAEYQVKIAEWKEMNVGLREDIERIKLLGLDPNQ